MLCVIFSVLCSSLKSTAMTILISINLDSNSIEHIVNDPFKFCPHLTSISMANNSISRLTSGKFLDLFIKIGIWIVFFLLIFLSLCIIAESFESTHSLQRLNISHNILSEFDGGILSSCKQIIELDVSHNQITILKLNEVINCNPRIVCVDCFHRRILHTFVYSSSVYNFRSLMLHPISKRLMQSSMYYLPSVKIIKINIYN